MTDSQLPLHEQVREDLRRQILTGKLRPGQRLPTEDELARQYRVSLMTLRQAQQPLVQEGLIHKRPRHGTFVADTAREQRRALLVCGLAALPGGRSPMQAASPYYQDSIHFCETAADARGLAIDTAWLTMFPETPHPAAELDRLANTHCGYIFLACGEEHPLLLRARRDDIPHVNLGKVQPQECAVWFDLAEAAELAWDSLRATVTRDHLGVVAVGTPGDVLGARLLARLVPGGIRHLQVSYRLPDRDFERWGYESIRRLTAADRSPRAYVFFDDILARGGTRALLEARLTSGACPVVVVGGQQEMTPYGLPARYVTHDTRAEATWAVEMLAAQLDGDLAGTKTRQSRFMLADEPAPLSAANESLVEMK